MRTVEKTVYTFDELEENIQEKIIEKHSDLNVQDDWYWSVYDYAEEQLGYEGFKDVEINFTGFWSQGDGASFTATLELPVIIKELTTAHRRRDYFLFLQRSIVFSALPTMCTQRDHA